MQITSLDHADKVLKEFAPKKIDGAYQLDRMFKVMDLLGNPQDGLQVIHVAGTAGKTSTSYFIAKMLQLSGKSVGLSVSPHISYLNERTQIDGIPLEEIEFCRLLEEFLVIPGLQAMQPTYFETMVAFAYWVFAKKKVDYAVIEVGLGGLLDGTNVVKRADKVCVITDIDFDHMHILGDTLDKIAFQKAGIIQDNNAVFMLQQADEIVATIHNYAAKHDAKLFIHGQSSEVPPNLPLYQQRNWSLAHDAYEYIMARDDLAEEELTHDVDWQVPGRMETIRNFILDGAHNPGKFVALVKTLQDQLPDQKFTCIIGIKTQKTYVSECIRLIAPITDKIICVPVTAVQDIAYKTLDPEVVAKICREAGLEDVVVTDSLKKAIAMVPDSTPTVITGSLFLLGPAKALLLNS